MKPHLTPRRREVMIYALRGYTQQQTAEALGLSIPTVQAHRIAVCDIFDVRNVYVAGAIAVRDGLLTHEELNSIGSIWLEDEAA